VIQGVHTGDDAHLASYGRIEERELGVRL